MSALENADVANRNRGADNFIFFEPADENEIDFVDTVIYTGKAQVGDVSVPLTLEFPAHPIDVKDNRIAMILNGYLAKEFAYDGLRHALAKRGKPALTMHPHGYTGHLEWLDINQWLHPDRVRSRATWAVVRHLQSAPRAFERYGLDINTLDLAGHSFGFLTGLELAQEHPDIINSITNIGGVGCETQQSAWRMLPRTLEFMVHELLPAVGATHQVTARKGWNHAIVSEWDYLASNPGRCLAEGLMAATIDSRGLVRELNRDYRRIGVTAILGLDDHLIPAYKSLRGSAELFNPITLITDGHLGPQIHPDWFAEALLMNIARLK